MSDNIRNLLDELRTAGQLDSVGGFTLDAAHAREKMKKFQLAEPHMYVLLLVSAAVQSGASSFDVSTGSGHIIVEFDGEPYEATQLEFMMGSLYGSLHSLLDARARDLALAVNAATALEAHRVVVESGEVRLTVTDGGEFREHIPRVGCTRVHVYESALWSDGKWLASLGDEPVEVGMLRNSCTYAPLCLTAGKRRRLDGSFDLGRPLVRSRIACEASEYDANLRLQVVCGGGEPRFRRTEQRVTAELAYGGALGRQQGLVFVVNGVSFIRTSRSLGLDPRFRGIIACPRLMRDLWRGAGSR
jgi:hypothetical protein